MKKELVVVKVNTVFSFCLGPSAYSAVVQLDGMTVKQVLEPVGFAVNKLASSISPKITERKFRTGWDLHLLIHTFQKACNPRSLCSTRQKESLQYFDAREASGGLEFFFWSLTCRSLRPLSARRSKSPFCLNWRTFSQISFTLILSWLLIPCQLRATRTYTHTRQTSEAINGLLSDTFNICFRPALPGGNILNQPDATSRNVYFLTLLFYWSSQYFNLFSISYHVSSFAIHCGSTLFGINIFFCQQAC